MDLDEVAKVRNQIRKFANVGKLFSHLRCGILISCCTSWSARKLSISCNTLAVFALLNETQRMHAALERRQFSLRVGTHQLHVRLAVVHLADPGRDRVNQRAARGENAVVAADDLILATVHRPQRPHNDGMSRVELAIANRCDQVDCNKPAVF